MIWGKYIGILLLALAVYYFLGVAFIAKIVIFIAILALIIHVVKNGFGTPGSSQVIAGLVGIIFIKNYIKLPKFLSTYLQ